MMAGFHKNMNYYTGSPSNSKHKERRPKKSHLSLGLAGSLSKMAAMSRHSFNIEPYGI
jgi:hypothetical protein